jgi:D-beta-D-heptose 7-phosphate kinase/D-beta-D-heptose 1-phosphate adenosyltransferase
MSWGDAKRWRAGVAGPVVFSNGVFDLLHRGHVDVLTAARLRGAALVVGINSDASVRRLKGQSRPVRTEAERAIVVAALEAVDAVVLFEQDTPLELIVELRPDVLVKGGDYDRTNIVGGAEVEEWGGEVMIVPTTPGQSTTSIIERLRASR